MAPLPRVFPPGNKGQNVVSPGNITGTPWERLWNIWEHQRGHENVAGAFPARCTRRATAGEPDLWVGLRWGGLRCCGRYADAFLGDRHILHSLGCAPVRHARAFLKVFVFSF